MKTIVCFGDSNCWGTIAEDHVITMPSRRFPVHVRWPGVVQDYLGNEYNVIEEGLSGRTTVFGETNQEFKRGDLYLYPCMMSHRPIDLMVMMLGGNDFRLDYCADQYPMDYGIRKLVEIIQRAAYCGDGINPPKILIVSPIDACIPTGRQDFFEACGGAICIDKIKALQKAQERLAAEMGCYYLNGALYGVPDEKDGFHLTEESHLRLGKAVAQQIRQIFSE